jgi:ribose 1,5-bisphosphokinase
MSRALIYMVGPSGVGKDSLLAWLLQQRHHDLPVPLHIARRSITRPEDGGTEIHEALTQTQFQALEAARGFAMCWHANGLHYGIRHAELAPLNKGHWVLINGSRAFVPRLRQDWPGAAVLHIEAPQEVVRNRLLVRGREVGAELEARIQRSQEISADRSPGDMVLVNAGSLEASGFELLDLLEHQMKAGDQTNTPTLGHLMPPGEGII